MGGLLIEVAVTGDMVMDQVTSEEKKLALNCPRSLRCQSAVLMQTVVIVIVDVGVVRCYALLSILLHCRFFRPLPHLHVCAHGFSRARASGQALSKLLIFVTITYK